jgi:hypothetical protein
LVSGRDTYPYQLMWQCTTCIEIMGADKNYVCAVCKEKCHQGHNLTPKDKTSAFCDCGSFRGELCKACLPHNEEVTLQVTTTLLNQLTALKDFSQNEDSVAQVSAIKENVCATLASCGVKSREVQKALLTLLNDPDASSSAEDALKSLMLGDPKFAAQIVKRMKQAKKPLMILRLAAVVSSLSRLPPDAIAVLAEKIQDFKAKPVAVLKLIRIMEKLLTNNPKKFEEVFPIVFDIYKDKMASQNKWRPPIEGIFQKYSISSEASLNLLVDTLKDKHLGVDEAQVKTISYLLLLKFNFKNLVKNCTKTWNSDNELQVLHDCRTCGISYVCQNCADECHKGHEVTFYWAPIVGVCGCKEKDKCSIFEKDEKALKKFKTYEIYEEYRPKAQKFLVETVSKVEKLKEFSTETKELILGAIDIKGMEDSDKSSLLNFFQSIIETIPEDPNIPIPEPEKRLADKVLSILQNKTFDHVIQFSMTGMKRKALMDSVIPLLRNWNFEYTAKLLLRNVFGPCPDVMVTILNRTQDKLVPRVKLIQVFLPEMYAYSDDQKKSYLDTLKAAESLFGILALKKPSWIPLDERPANYASKPNMSMLSLYETEDEMTGDYNNSKWDSIYALQALKLSKKKQPELFQKMIKTVLTTVIEENQDLSFNGLLITMDDVKNFVEKYDQNSTGLSKIKSSYPDTSLDKAVEQFFQYKVASQWELDDAAAREKEEEENANKPKDENQDKLEENNNNNDDDKSEDMPDDKPVEEKKPEDATAKPKKNKKKKKKSKKSKSKTDVAELATSQDGPEEDDVEEPSAESSNEPQS